jgi:hypothetical protein
MLRGTPRQLIYHERVFTLGSKRRARQYPRALRARGGATPTLPSRAFWVLLVAGLLVLSACNGGGGALASRVSGALPSGSTLPTRSRTVAPTRSPTTEASTQVPTTDVPTTNVPTTDVPTQPPTQVPTTQVPTQVPTTQATPPPTPISATGVESSVSTAPAASSSSTSPWVWVVLAALLAIGLAAAIVARRRAGRNGLDQAIADALRTGAQAHERLAADLTIISVERRIPAGLAESERSLDVLTGQLASLEIPPDRPGLSAARASLSEATETLRASVRPLLAATAPDLGAAAGDATMSLTMFEAALGRLRDAAGAPRPT